MKKYTVTSDFCVSVVMNIISIIEVSKEVCTEELRILLDNISKDYRQLGKPVPIEDLIKFLRNYKYDVPNNYNPELVTLQDCIGTPPLHLLYKNNK